MSSPYLPPRYPPSESRWPSRPRRWDVTLYDHGNCQRYFPEEDPFWQGERYRSPVEDPFWQGERYQIPVEELSWRGEPRGQEWHGLPNYSAYAPVHSPLSPVAHSPQTPLRGSIRSPAQSLRPYRSIHRRLDSREFQPQPLAQPIHFAAPFSFPSPPALPRSYHSESVTSASPPFSFVRSSKIRIKRTQRALGCNQQSKSKRRKSNGRDETQPLCDGPQVSPTFVPQSPTHRPIKRVRRRALAKGKALGDVTNYQYFKQPSSRAEDQVNSSRQIDEDETKTALAVRVAETSSTALTTEHHGLVTDKTGNLTPVCSDDLNTETSLDKCGEPTDGSNKPSTTTPETQESDEKTEPQIPKTLDNIPEVLTLESSGEETESAANQTKINDTSSSQLPSLDVLDISNVITTLPEKCSAKENVHSVPSRLLEMTQTVSSEVSAEENAQLSENSETSKGDVMSLDVLPGPSEKCHPLSTITVGTSDNSQSKRGLQGFYSGSPELVCIDSSPSQTCDPPHNSDVHLHVYSPLLIDLTEDDSSKLATDSDAANVNELSSATTKPEEVPENASSKEGHSVKSSDLSHTINDTASTSCTSQTDNSRKRSAEEALLPTPSPKRCSKRPALDQHVQDVPLEEAINLLCSSGSHVIYYTDKVDVNRQSCLSGKGWVLHTPLNNYSSWQLYELRDLPFGSPEYNEIESFFQESSARKRFVVNSIKRVENRELIIRFRDKISQIENTHGEAAVMRLFHGTFRSNVNSICEGNFDFRLAGTSTNHTYFGAGVSFSPISYYSSHYGDLGRMRSMFVCDVVIGKVCSVRNPKSGRPFGYDTNIKYPVPQVVVKFDDDVFYPSYIVDYTVPPNHAGLQYDRFEHYGANNIYYGGQFYESDGYHKYYW